MHYQDLLGISCIEKGWVPSPAYALRRAQILRRFDELPTGRVLEFGCGAGGILYDLARRGFTCDAVEASPAARAIAEFINSGWLNVSVNESAPKGPWQHYDYVIAFEVLEHIENDREALEGWVSHLKPGGRLLISVPAHPSRWNASDVWAGHYRRYTASGLRRLIESTGLKVKHLEFYGFPLTNLTDPLRARIHRKKLEREQSGSADKYQYSLRSGVERPVETRLYPIISSLPGLFLLRIAFWLQHLFSRVPLGNGILPVAIRPSR